MARQGALRRLDAVGSGAPVGWPGAHLDRGAEVARIGNNLNQIARWANTHKGTVEVIGHLIAIERSLAALAPAGCPDTDAR